MNRNDPQKCDRLIESKKREIVLLQLLKSLGNHLGDRINGSNRTCRAMGEVREYLDSIFPALQAQSMAAVRKGGNTETMQSVCLALENVKKMQENINTAERRYRVHMRTAQEIQKSIKALLAAKAAVDQDHGDDSSGDDEFPAQKSSLRRD